MGEAETTGDRIRRCRVRAGMTQLALACRAGVAQNSVSFWETGRAQPTAGSLQRLADALGVPMDELTGNRRKAA